MKRMKTKKILAIMLAVCILSFALGFFGVVDLNKTQKTANGNTNDLLIGVFITTEYLDLLDMESYLEDNIGKILNSGNIIADDTSEYENRIYATLTDKSFTDKETGEYIQTAEYVFEDLEGYSFYDCFIAEEGDGQGYNTLVGNGIVCDSNVHYESGDNYENITLEGTLYVLDSTEMLYYNPVYQGEDGSVYLMSGMGSNSIGSYSMKGEITVTVDGETVSKKNEVIINTKQAENTQKIELIQLDKNNEIITRDTFSTEDLPQTYKPEKQAESIIIEQTNAHSYDGISVKRRLVDKNEDTFEVSKAKDDFVCYTEVVEIAWQ